MLGSLDVVLHTGTLFRYMELPRARVECPPGPPRGPPPAHTTTVAETASSIERAIDVLFHLHAGGSPRGVSDVARDLGMAKSSVHRVLATLGRRGLVEQDVDGRYRPGVALLALGLGVLDREPLASAARPVLERESERSGETAFLTVARGGRIVVLDKCEGRSFLRVAPAIGAEVPVATTASGKLVLALDPAAVGLGQAPWPTLAATMPSDAASLEADVGEARRRGWALNRDEWIDGLTVVAAPVLLRERMLGCFVIAAPSSRAGQARIDELAARCVSAADEIGRVLDLEEKRR